MDKDFLTESLFADFKDFLRSEWMKVPEFISTHGLSTTTTNCAECSHSQMKKESRCAHPNPFVFINMLTDLYKTTNLDLNHLENNIQITRQHSPRSQAKLDWRKSC